MTNRSEVRRLLWRWGRVMDFCRSRQKEVAEFQQRLIDCTALSAQTLDGMPHGTDVSDPTQRAAAKLADIAESYETIIGIIQRDIDEELRFKRAIDDMISDLPYEQQRILELRYKGNHEWVYIGRTMCFDETWTKRLEAKAIDYLAEIIRSHEKPHFFW